MLSTSNTTNSSLNSKIIALQAQLTNLQTQIKDLQTRENAANQYDNITAQINNLKNQLQTLQTQTNANDQYNNITSQINKLQNQISTLQTQSNAQNQFQNLRAQITALQNQLNSLQSQVSTLQTQTNAANQFNNLSAQIEALQTQVTNIQNQISDLQNQLIQTNTPIPTSTPNLSKTPNPTPTNAPTHPPATYGWRQNGYLLYFYVNNSAGGPIANQSKADTITVLASTWNSHAGYPEGAGNLFTGNGDYLGSAQFMLARWGDGTGQVRAALFDAKTLPPGSTPITTSINTIDISKLATTFPLGTICTFMFDGTVQLTNGHQYLIAFYIESGNVSNGNGIEFWEQGSGSGVPTQYGYW